MRDEKENPSFHYVEGDFFSHDLKKLGGAGSVDLITDLKGIHWYASRPSGSRPATSSARMARSSIATRSDVPLIEVPKDEQPTFSEEAMALYYHAR